jgi:hypothetical protein
MARDGKTILEDWNAYGYEWQVRDTESKLFHSVEGPQYPQPCTLPAKPKEEKRRLGGIHRNVAEKACAKVEETSRADCIFDVMATKDVSTAGAY